MKPFQLAPAGGKAAAEKPRAPARREDRINVLLIDDQPANLLALESLLDAGDYCAVKATSGAEGLRRMLETEFALVLLDVLMPGMDGFETASLIRRRALSRDTPIIFITAGSSNETHVSRGYSLGAVDYIYKPIVPEILKAKVQVFADLYRKTQRLRISERALRIELDEHGKTLAARLESEEKYRELFSRASDAIVVFDSEDGAVLDANDAALALYGYPRREFLRLAAADLAVEPEPAGADERGAAGHRASRRALVYHRRRDGARFPVEVSRASVVVSGRKMVMTLTRDLTERRQAEEAARLHEREEMQRKVIATVSHELRTPITAIKASVETLQRGGVAEPKALPRFLKIIESQADRLGGIVEDLLIGAEIESGKLKTDARLIDLRPFVVQCVKDIAPVAARRKVSITADVKHDVDVWMDHEHLTRILQNLLDNAIKYNKKGGAVRVTARRTDEGDARISIHDTGIGIDADDLPHIFQQFYRSEKVRSLAIRGTGLGLSILKTLVESNGGRIWAESAKDKGSVFSFTLPLAVHGAAPEAARRPQSPAKR